MSAEIIQEPVSMPTPPLEERLLRMIPHPMLRFETHIVEHCDLNCRMCTHFSPLAVPRFAELSTFSRDLRRLRELFGDDVAYIMLLGGEPLLHPELPDFLCTARTFFPNTDVILYTNGLKLPQMNPVFWESCEATAFLSH